MILLNPELQRKYEQDRNSLRLFAQENPRDRLNVEIGDTKDGAIIQPQIKLLRFDNEYNLSIRLLHNEKEIPKIQTDGNRLIWQAGQTKIRFYEKEKSENLPDGGYEMDQIVNLKKSGNVFYYTLQTKGITFEPQPELTPQEKAQGCKRPDWIIGGYVLFANNKPINLECGKEYRAGKIGEIHAPIITDSTGRFAKCGLLISAERGLMRITVSDDFAAKAKNPCVLDPTIGYSTAGASSNSISNNYAIGSKRGVALASDGLVASISFYTTDLGYGRKFKGFICNSARSIITNGLGPETNNGNGASWKTSTLSTKAKIVSGNTYIPCAVCDGTNTYYYYDASGDDGDYYDGYNNYNNPTGIGTGTYSGHKISIYATYQALIAGWLPFFI